MSLYSALRSGVSSLQAQTQAMSMVSNNISNLNTNGYKRTSASFSTLVSSGNSATSFSAGSVISRPNLQATEIGQITKSSSNTDLSINGQGFFPVAKVTDIAFSNATGKYQNNGEVVYTRLGDFTRNQNGLLENSSGYVLLAWPRNATDSGYEQTSLEGQLEPVAVTATTGTPKETTSVSVNANLSSNTSEPNFFSTTISIFDKQGTSHVAKINFRRHPTEARTYNISMEMVNSNVAMITNYDNATAPGSTDPNLMSVLYNSETRNEVYLQYDARLENLSTAQLTALRTQFAVSYTDADGNTVSPNITSVSISEGRVTLALDSPIPPRDEKGNLTYTNLQVTYDPPATATDGIRGYQIDAEEKETTTAVAVIGPASSAAATGTPIVDAYSLGKVKFSADGTMSVDSLTATGAGINNIGALANGTFEFSVDFAGDGIAKDFSGKSDNVEMTLNFLAQAGSTGLTSYDAPHAVYSISQNGSSAGSFTAVEINTSGEVAAAFNVGDNRRLAQIPVAVFSNANQLQQIDGNAFRKTTNAGAVIIRTAGSSGAGLIASATLEASNVDLANEFTDMIVTQRAYSASTKIITTADEMLEELVRAKR